MAVRVVHQRQEPVRAGRPVAATDWIDLYLEEDLGADGDITSKALLDEGAPGGAAMVLREDAFVVGLVHAAAVFRRLGATPGPRVEEGAWQEAGTPILRVTGPARAILAGERLALNMVARMSGIATGTRRLQDRLEEAGSGCRVAGTRKTTPGFRVFEKEAIVAGGGDPHRMGLFDEAMVKDNHRAAAGDVAAAVQKVRAAWPGRRVTVEVESLADALAAARAGADWLLIDNQDAETGKAWADQVREAVPGVRIEASGGIRPEAVAAYGWADRISMGALTQDVRCVDVGLDWEDDA